MRIFVETRESLETYYSDEIFNLSKRYELTWIDDQCFRK